MPQVLQRGATNLTFHAIDSAIDIPPFSDAAASGDEEALVQNTSLWNTLIQNPNQTALVDALLPQISIQSGVEESRVREIFERTIGIGKGDDEPLAPATISGTDILTGEYEAFLAPDRINPHPKDGFIKTTTDLSINYGVEISEAADQLIPLLGTLVKVERLREVRALIGFSRLAPASGGDLGESQEPGRFSTYSGKSTGTRLVPADRNGRSGWLPAIEVHGEGIFLQLNSLELHRWERRTSVEQRIARLKARAGAGELAGQHDLRPQFILLHTLAHLLIRQLSFECGYPLASLRERIYSAPTNLDNSMAGILIYTAAGDAEGTLGGLVREGEPQRFVRTILSAIQTADWCSSDPLCRESDGQGLGALNLAACHACSLVPETSCTVTNRLLDRTMVTGTAGDRSLGYFGDVLETVNELRARSMGAANTCD